MADHAPEMRPLGERLSHWLQHLSDARISAYMAGLALVIAILAVWFFGQSISL